MDEHNDFAPDQPTAEHADLEYRENEQRESADDGTLQDTVGDPEGSSDEASAEPHETSTEALPEPETVEGEVAEEQAAESEVQDADEVLPEPDAVEGGDADADADSGDESEPAPDTGEGETGSAGGSGDETEDVPEPEGILIADAEDAEGVGTGEESVVVQEAEAVLIAEADTVPQAAPVGASGDEPPAEPVVVVPATADGSPEEAAAAPASGPAAADLVDQRLIDLTDAARFKEGWRDVKATFVDDPADAVRQAGSMVGNAVDELTTALTRLRETLDGQAADTAETDTENLRLVLRGYGSLLSHILTR